MINREQLLYGRQVMRKKLEKEQEEERRRRQTNDRIYKSFQSVTEIPNKIIDMTEELKKVREKDYISFEDSYISLSGGGNRMRGLKTK